jgi:hypothetical protein
MKIPRTLAVLASTGALFVLWAAGCSGKGNVNFQNSGGANGSSGGTNSGQGNPGGSGTGTANTTSSGIILTTSSAGSTGTGTPCTGLQCQVHACSGGGSTTITGTIYDPAGKNPLYGVVAYVPNSKPQPLLSGASCYSCSDLYTGDPVAAAVTDATGKFTIKNAPDGMNIPLVIQVGKWRRQFVVPSVGMCMDTAVPDNTLLLPKNGSQGDMPNIAISTGGADTLECLLVRVGVDPAEYVSGTAGNGHIHIFAGTGGPDTATPSPAPEQALWSSKQTLMAYDILMLSCEGHETDNMNQQALFDYAAAGGRAFASHFHYAWFNTGPFSTQNLAQWNPGSNDIGNINADVVTTDWNNMPFIRGQALHDWLQNVGALTGNLLPIQVARNNATVTAANTPSQPWIVVDGQPTQPQDFTFDTPFGVTPDKQCGRIAYSDMHVGAASNDYGGISQTVPDGCTMQDLSPQEKALEFILFDLSSCVTPNNMPQMPPPVGTPQ